jgi:diacylglycerol kinase (ATP)
VNIHLIVNPNAGKRGGSAVAAEAEDTLRRAGVTVTTRFSTYPGEAVGLAREAASAAAVDAVVAVGGDGTLFEVINGLCGSGRSSSSASSPIVPIPVAQIPVGTGNSFIKDLSVNSPQEAIDAILAGHRRTIDLGRFTTADGAWYFVNLLGAGFVSSVAHTAGRYKKLGALSYILAVVQETIRLTSNPLTLTIDGRAVHRDGVFVEICNSRYTGGDMMMAPDAAIDDGLFDVVVMSRASRRKLLSLFPKIFSGRHVEDPLIEVFRGQSITLETSDPWLLTPDGETFGITPISVEIIPGGLEILAPEGDGLGSSDADRLGGATGAQTP